MSQLNVDDIYNNAGTGNPNLPAGVKITGVTTFLGSQTEVNVSGITTLTGHVSTGSTVGAAGSVYFPDSKGINFGDAAEGDLQIFHASNISKVVDSSGDLRIMSDTIRLQRNAGGENFLYGIEGGKVGLYFDGSEKVETTNTGAVVTGILTATTDLKVGTTILAEATSGIVTAKTFVPTEGQVGNRNLVINGACTVAQRATSYTSSTQGYMTVDRFKLTWSGADNVIEQHQQTLTSSDAGPWEEGFRNAFKITNGNQSSGAGAADQVIFETRLEAQNMATSGWDYTSASSYITLSFWIKSSVSQTFYGVLETLDGTGQNYPYSFAASSTWTKITKTIPGNANIQFDVNENNGLQLEFHPFMGTDFTNDSVSLNTWATAASGTRHPDMTSTWWTTDDATMHITGLQLEVGSTATPFEHRSYGDELLRCQRYFEIVTGPSVVSTSASETLIAVAQAYTTARALANWTYKVQKRAYPSVSTDDASEVQVLVAGTGWVSAGSFGGNTNVYATRFDADSVSGSPMTAGHCCEMRLTADGRILIDAEL